MASEFAGHTCDEDKERVKRFSNVNLRKSWDRADLKNYFYKTIMQPLQNVCRAMKIVGKKRSKMKKNSSFGM